ncbi:MAG: D-glycero-beta-D-manno-heptose-7-phosphate kinase [Deltaproteobacteria bacterium]|nr:D-glycero-beta-D-manno-heptose-7-phosphate kinase [Deltaproteobacteria bacterium]
MDTLKKIEPSHLLKCVERFSKSSVLVLGDVILDSYIWGQVERICPEAPVPVVEVTRDSSMLGGAGNVVRNLRTLGARVLLCGAMGEDSAALEIKKRLKEIDVSVEGLIVDPHRLTSKKTRVVAGHQQVVRFDTETKTAIAPQTTQEILRYLKEYWSQLDAVIVSDYGKGVIHPALLDGLRRLHQQNPKLISVDPKERNMEFYKGFSLITPNKKEAAFAAQKTIETLEDLKEAGRKIIHRLQCENLVVTLGAEGMALFKKEGEFLKVPTFAKEVFDVSGAGDTVVSVLTLALSSGASLNEAVVLANYAAGVVVGKLGTATVTASELKKYIQVEKKRIAPKNFTLHELSTRA